MSRKTEDRGHWSKCNLSKISKLEEYCNWYSGPSQFNALRLSRFLRKVRILLRIVYKLKYNLTLPLSLKKLTRGRRSRVVITRYLREKEKPSWPDQYLI